MQPYYKVLIVMGGKYYPQIYRHNLPYTHLEYKVGEWTEPILKGSKLFVFDNLCAANEFAQDFAWFSPYYIFKCEVKNPSKIKFISDNCSSIKTFWEIKNKKKSIKGVPHKKAIKNSIICDAVMITEKVE